MSSRTHTTHRRPGRVAGQTAMVALTVGALVAASCSSSPSASRDTSSTGSSSSGSPSGAILELDAPAMDSVVEDTAEEFGEPGMVVVIKTPQGSYTEAYGMTSMGGTDPVTLDTKVRVGSNTKTWTGTVILQMVQEGKLELDDPVSTYRPDVPNGDNITIAELLTMRSGLYNYTATLELNEALDTEPDKVWTPEELLALAYAYPPSFPPDQGWEYSNTNTVLLGLIAEDLDNKPLARIFQDRLFTPLGMTGTSFPADTDTSIPAPYSRGYFYGTNVETMDQPSLSADRLAAVASGELKATDATNDNPSWTWAAGQGISTANDLATWVKAMVGGDLLDGEVQDLRMASIQPSDIDDPESAGYGYNIAQMGPLLGHTGELPGYNSFMGYDPVNEVTIVAWGNLAPTADGEDPAVTLVQRLIPLVYAPSAAKPADVEDIDPTT